MHIVSTFRLICRILDWWPLGELQFKFTASFISPNFFHWEIKPRGDRNKWWDSSWFKESVLSTHESVFRELRARIRNNKTLLNRMTLAKQIWLSILMQSFIWLFYLLKYNFSASQITSFPPRLWTQKVRYTVLTA